MSIRPGSRLGVDVGTVRVGVARSDRDAIVSTPFATVTRGENSVSEIIDMLREIDAVEVIVGLPLSLAGIPTASTQDAIDFAHELAGATDVPIRLVDERLSTLSAQRSLHSAGKTTRSSRPVIDQVAAAIILQHALDVERSSGKPPGELFTLDEG